MTWHWLTTMEQLWVDLHFNQSQHLTLQQNLQCKCSLLANPTVILQHTYLQVHGCFTGAQHWTSCKWISAASSQWRAFTWGSRRAFVKAFSRFKRSTSKKLVISIWTLWMRLLRRVATRTRNHSWKRSQNPKTSTKLEFQLYSCSEQTKSSS